MYIPGSGLRSAPFLDITGRVESGGERGLLGLVFHPSFNSNGYFYVYYTNLSGNLQISSAGVTVTVSTSEANFRVLTEADQLDGGTVLPGFTLAVRDLFAVLERHG